MKKWNKDNIITFLIIIGIIVIAIFALQKELPATDKEISKCIGENSILYTQLGCHACEAQEDLFGENYQYLTIIDCWYDNQKCIDINIEYTPTWIIDGEKYIGVQSFDELKALTGC
jgi:hypothetical protein